MAFYTINGRADDRLVFWPVVTGLYYGKKILTLFLLSIYRAILKFDLPHFDHFVMIDLRVRPCDWQVGRMSEMCDLIERSWDKRMKRSGANVR